MELTDKKYKESEVGFIPNDWDLKTYGESFEFLSTAAYSRAELSNYDEILYVHYGDIHTKWNFSLDIQKYILPTVSKQQAKNYHFIKDGDVIMADASEDYEGIGKSVEVKNVGSNRIISGLHTFLLRDKKELIANGFKGYIHANSIVKRQFEKLATGLKVYGVSKNVLKNVLIPLPSLKSEQTAIATALSDTDALIDNLEKLIAKKRNIKQGVMQELLTGKKRLEGYSGEWKEETLSNLIFSFQNGYAFSATKYLPDGIPIITMANIGLDGSFQFDGNKINFWDLNELNSLKNFHVKNGDVIISMTDVTPEKNLIGRMTMVNSNQIMLLNQRVGLLRIDKRKINPLFLVEYSNMRKWRDYSIASASLGVQANISTKDILNGLITLPSIEEQNSIAQVLIDLYNEIFLFEKKLIKYRMIKQGMMQTLLTGKIRLI